MIKASPIGIKLLVLKRMKPMREDIAEFKHPLAHAKVLRRALKMRPLSAHQGLGELRTKVVLKHGKENIVLAHPAMRLSK